MTNHAHVAGRQAELRRDCIRGAIVVEGEHEHGALALGQRRQAAAEPLGVERLRSLAVGRREVDRERLEDPDAPPAAAPAVDHHLPRRAEHERHDLRGVANGPFTQLLEHHHEHVLHEIGGRRLVAQVLEAIEPYPWTQAPADLGLRGRVARGGASDDPARERRVVVRL